MPEPLTFTVTRIINAPNDAVWHVLGDFGREHRWTRSVADCERDTPEVRVGTVRNCKLPRPLMGRTHARETLTEFEHGSALRYSLDGAAGPFASAASRWSTTQTADGATAVTVEGYFEPKNFVVRALVWHLAKPMIRRLTRDVLAELDAFVSAQVATTSVAKHQN